MSAGPELRSGDGAEPSPRPRIAACRSCPEKLVFIEAGNTDGWIATDAAVAVDR